MDHSVAIEHFAALAQVPVSVAETILERNNWDIEDALNDFYNSGTQQSETQASRVPQQAPSTQKTKPKSKFKSFQQLVNEEDDEDDEQNFFAGGGRGSGLNVENPDNPKNVVRDLLKRAESQGASGLEEDDETPSAPRFSGVGYQLGNSTTESRTVGSAAPKKAEKTTREITFWKDGFQVGDGKLYRYDDPANSHYLNELNSGRAPLALLDVQFGQEVIVNIQKKLDEEYKPQKKKIGGFGGSGHRLGSPVSPDYVPSQPQTTEATPEVQTKDEGEQEQPQGDAQVQIRLGDGRRVVRRVNSADPVQTLFDFVATQTDSLRGWTLNHAFPVMPIEEKSKSIKDLGLVNAVVVQRWV